MSLSTQFVDYFTRVQASEGWNRVLASFARFLAVEQTARVLDVGCGPGSLVRKLACEVAFACGCDADRYMIEQAHNLAAEEGLRNVVRAVVDRIEKERQLDNTQLTLHDLNQVIESFVSTLRGTYHPRIQYPAAELPASLPVDTAPARNEPDSDPS